MIKKLRGYKNLLFTSVIVKIPYYQFLQSAFWSVTGAVFLRSQVIIVSIFIAKFLPLQEFGQLGLLRSTIGTFSIFASVGVSMGATKFISEALANARHYLRSWIRFSFLITFITATILSACIFFFAENLSSSIAESTALTSYLRLSAVVIFVATILATQIGILNGFQSFKRVALLNLYGALLAIPLQIYLAYLYGITGFLIATAISTFVQSIFYQFIIVSLYKNHHATQVEVITIDQKKTFINFCIPAALSGFLVSPVSWYCNTVLVNNKNGFSEMAFFDVANNWRMILIFLPATISQVILPKIVAINDKSELKKIIYYNLGLNGVVALLTCVILFLVSQQVLGLYGEEFLDGEFAFNLLIASTVFVALGNVTGQLIAGKMKMWYGLGVNLIWAGILIGLTHQFITIKQMGAEGLAWAYLVSYLIHTIIQIFIFYIYFKKDSLPIT